jgi:hypothetical protein
VGELPVPKVPLGSRDAYPELVSAYGPAKGGEPCRICSGPISATAHPAHKARHVCSPDHNAALKRRLKRAEARQAREAAQPGPLQDGVVESVPILTDVVDTQRRPSRTFRTRDGGEFPYEFGRDGPVLGDVIERDGLLTRYMLCELDLDGLVIDKLVVAYNDETESFIVLGCSPDTDVRPYVYWTSLHHRVFFQGYEEPALLDQPFEHSGKQRVWYRETIRDVDEHGDTYSWTATVCGAAARPTLWSPRFRARSKRYERTSKAANAAAARAREAGVTIQIDRIDPYDIFERDDWTCQICSRLVDRTKGHREDDSPSLDHIRPISRGGDHIASNLQTSHLRCNIAKGDRIDPPR